jgi:hypothetical protein
MAKKIIFYFFIFLFLITSVSAEINNSEYYIIIQENGNAIIAITLEGQGEITIPIQEDVETINLEGGLYIMEEDTATIAIGTTEKAVLVYKTAMLTQKSNNEWKFNMNLEQTTNKEIIIAMPETTTIKQTIPKTFLETGDFIKLHLENSNEIEIIYNFPILTNDEVDNNYNILYLITGILLIITIVLIYNLKSKNKISSRQEQILQTLTENESKIIKLLLESKKLLKRSFIEKKLEIAKSSLAATLTNLERKKLITINKTYTTHLIKLNDWFKKQ